MDSFDFAKWLRDLANAIEAGNVAVDNVKGMTLDQLEIASKDGWDKLDETIAQGEKAGHEND